MSGVGAWIRYGDPIGQDEIDFAARHYRAAILQPWEVGAAHALKERQPAMTVLAYKCLSSTRDYEPGPVHSSGVSWAEAEEDWFATRRDGTRIAWQRYPGHWQMRPWDAAYRRRWVANVVDELTGSPFDGVMADNDVFDDYYGLDLPLSDVTSMAEIRAGLGVLIEDAGTALNRVGKRLLPNIAESRREPGRWDAHAAYGGGFEEVWLGWAPEQLFDETTSLAQMPQLTGPGLSILRVPTDGHDTHPNFLYGLAAFWVFGAGHGAYTATAHDDYSRTQHVRAQDWDLGEPLGRPRGGGGLWQRSFTNGWAAVNLNADRRRRRRLAVPPGLMTEDGRPAGRRTVLPARRGLVLRRG